MANPETTRDGNFAIETTNGTITRITEIPSVVDTSGPIDIASRPPTSSTTPRKRRAKWQPEFDEVLRADWHKGISLKEFGRRFGYGRDGAVAVRNRAVALGLMVWPPEQSWQWKCGVCGKDLSREQMAAPSCPKECPFLDPATIPTPREVVSWI